MSQFFLAPTFTGDSTDKEMNAVDSEFKQSLQSDAWRAFSLIQKNSNPDSTFNRFNCGNLETLKVDGIRDELLGFHKRWYSGNIMNMVMSSNHSLDTQEKWARDMFGGIENKNVEVPNLVDPAPFSDNEKGMLL
jgi:secreted Zn-dependent insulinase-like peptidase